MANKDKDLTKLRVIIKACIAQCGDTGIVSSLFKFGITEELTKLNIHRMEDVETILCMVRDLLIGKTNQDELFKRIQEIMDIPSINKYIVYYFANLDEKILSITDVVAYNCGKEEEKAYRTLSKKYRDVMIICAVPQRNDEPLFS